MADPNNLTTGQGFGTDVAGILSLITGLQGKDISNASQVADIADPFRHERPAYMDAMRAFFADPGSIFKDPAFIEAQKVGGEAVARNAGAAGMGNSGNKLASLFQFGESSALDFEKQKFNELLPLTGATTGSPYEAAKATAAGQAGKTSALGAGIAGIADLLGRLGIPQGIAQTIASALGGGTNSLFNNPMANASDPYTGSSSFAGGGDYYMPGDLGSGVGATVGGGGDWTSSVGGTTDFSNIDWSNLGIFFGGP